MREVDHIAYNRTCSCPYRKYRRKQLARPAENNTVQPMNHILQTTLVALIWWLNKNCENLRMSMRADTNASGDISGARYSSMSSGK